MDSSGAFRAFWGPAIVVSPFDLEIAPQATCATEKVYTEFERLQLSFWCVTGLTTLIFDILTTQIFSTRENNIITKFEDGLWSVVHTMRFVRYTNVRLKVDE